MPPMTFEASDAARTGIRMGRANRYLARLRQNLEQNPATPFAWLVDRHGAQPLSRGELAEDCRRIAGLLQHHGLREGEQVLIFLRHGRELYGACFGTMLGGFVPAFMPCSTPKQNPALYWRSHAELLAKIRPAALIADPATFAEMAAAGLQLGGLRCIDVHAPAPAPGHFVDRPGDAIALLQHSSGTTGLKKGVALSFDAIAAQIDSYADALQLGPTDVLASWLPLYHDMGLIACCITPAYLGIPVAQMDAFEWLARPDLLPRTMAELGATFAWLPNFAFEHLALACRRHADQFDLSRLRALINCSEPCKPASFDRFAAAFAPSGIRPDQLQCCYAMAESVFAVTQTRLGAPPLRLTVDPATLEAGSVPCPAETGQELIECGTPIAGITVEIVDAQRRKLAAGAVGEIVLSGEFLFAGYNTDPERTAGQINEAGRYHTNDMGFLRDGHRYVLGRLDDMIIVNGRNLYAHEVEATVSAIDGVKGGRAVAVATFDPRVGSASLVVIAEADPLAPRDAGDIQRDIMSTIFSVFAIAPRRVRVVEPGWLVKTTSGKMSRRENLAKFLAAEANAGASVPASA